MVKISSNTETDYGLAWRAETGKVSETTIDADLDNKEFIFNFSQLVPGKTFILEKSTDLKKWTSVHTFKAKKINENFSELFDKSEPLFFYRLNWNPMD